MIERRMIDGIPQQKLLAVKTYLQKDPRTIFSQLWTEHILQTPSYLHIDDLRVTDTSPHTVLFYDVAFRFKL
jgi:hypothetical protein